MPRPRKNAAGSSSGGTASDALPEAFLAGFDETLPKTPQVYDILRRAIVTLVLKTVLEIVQPDVRKLAH